MLKFESFYDRRMALSACAANGGVVFGVSQMAHSTPGRFALCHSLSITVGIKPGLRCGVPG